MSTELARNAPFTSEQVDLIKRQLAPGATDDEVAVFLQLCQYHELNPFAREVFLSIPLDQAGKRKKNKDGTDKAASNIVARDGYLAVADRHPQYAGMVSGVVKDTDAFEFGLMEPKHVWGEGRSKIRGAYAYVYRLDRKFPVRFYAEWNEYGAPNVKSEWSTWSKFPSAMILKVAEGTALRRAFRLSGVVAEGEIDGDDVPAPRPEIDPAVNWKPGRLPAAPPKPIDWEEPNDQPTAALPVVPVRPGVTYDPAAEPELPPIGEDEGDEPFIHPDQSTIFVAPSSAGRGETEPA